MYSGGLCGMDRRYKWIGIKCVHINRHLTLMTLNRERTMVRERQTRRTIITDPAGAVVRPDT